MAPDEKQEELWAKRPREVEKKRRRRGRQGQKTSRTRRG